MIRFPINKAKREQVTHVATSMLVLAAAALGGCRGIPTGSERQARAQLQEAARSYFPADRTNALPVLGTNSTLTDLCKYALLRQPKVAAAYFEYAAAVERITTERSLPDPVLTFEMDITDIVMTAMPGVMFELPWVKRLRIRADVASAESQARLHQLETAVLETLSELRQAYHK